jgi:hypothetical protein
MPEQAGAWVLRCSGTAPCIDICPKFGHHAVGKWQDPGLEELGLPNRDRATLKVDVIQIEAGKLAPPQPRAIGQQQHGVDAQRTKRRPWRRIGTRNIEHLPHVGG